MASFSPLIRRLFVVALVAGVFSWIFDAALFRDRNFVYRDAGHFYYPLLRLVRDEWNAGRWPLWNPYENAGMPLLGNPASAVLYPPRIVLFQWLPLDYGTAYKWYILSHVLLAAGAAYVMARNWQASEFAAGLAALSYAFGAAIMFQYCNVIFLVGAAWVPLGLAAIDRMLRDGDRLWAVALGLILAMQLTGGDPQAAYLTGGLGAVYLVLLDRRFGVYLGAGLSAIYLARAGRDGLDKPLSEWVVSGLALVVLAGCVWWLRSRGGVPASGDALRLARRRRAALAIAAAVAVGTSAVQWIPTWEFSRISLRAAGGVHHEAYAFWLAPWRAIELFWPNISGHQFPIHTRWLDLVHVSDRVWVPSIYLSVAAVIAGLGAWRLGSGPVWQRWMSITLVMSLWAAAGPAGGIRWYLTTDQVFGVTPRVGSSSDADEAASPREPQPRLERETPEGGLYWFMVEFLPGFGAFRYPAKLMTFAAVALAALGAVGWDRWFAGGSAGAVSSRVVWVLGVLGVVSLVMCLAVYLTRDSIAGWFAGSLFAHGTPYYGPLQPDLAVACIVRALGATALTASTLAVLVALARAGLPGDPLAALALVLVAADLGLANRWLVSTAAQAKMDAVPLVQQIIADAESRDADAAVGQPYRVHRVSIWSPPRWITRVSPDQDEEVFRWEHATIQPKYGVPHGVQYTINEGTLEPYDYWWFFAPFYSNATVVPRSIVYYPIRGYDMWGAKYFVLPTWRGVHDDADQNRGIRSFLLRSELIAESPADADDYQVRRNTEAYPRAWLVHRAIHRAPIAGFTRQERMDRMREILYAGNDPFWREPNLDRQIQNPREVAWIEHPDPAYVASLQAPSADRSADRCRVTRYEPDRVEIEVETATRGIVVLADLYFSGWRATVDGAPAPILRTNRIMRGVPLAPGKHLVSFVYRPLSFRVGAAVSLISLIGSIATLAWRRR